MSKVLVVSANLGSKRSNKVVNQWNHDVDFICYNDDNMPSRDASYTPRMLGKIPKMLAWELKPGYDFYIWMDGYFGMGMHDSVDWFIQQIGDADAAFFKHPARNSIKAEADFMINKVSKGDKYLEGRIKGENILSQVDKYLNSDFFEDKILFAACAFIYSKNLIANKRDNVMKEWYYQTCTGSVRDQLSLPYVLQVYSVNYKVIKENPFGLIFLKPPSDEKVWDAIIKYEELTQKKSDINEHLPTLKKYASECEHVTELGVRWVVSTWALLAGKPKKMVSYDIQHPTACGGNIQAVEEAANGLVDFKFIKADVLSIQLEETDLLFIDTKHDYLQLRSELTLHSNKARKYIILHDTTTFGNRGESGGKGLKPAIDEFLSESPEWEVHEVFTNNNGLTILKRKELGKTGKVVDLVSKEQYTKPYPSQKGKMKFLVVLPDKQFYLWQILVQIANFRKFGYEENTTYLIAYMNSPSGTLKNIINSKDLKCTIHLYDESKRIYEHRAYNPSMKPFLVRQYMEEFPEQQKETFFYTDPDVVFTRPIDFSPYMQKGDETWYLSDCRSYLNSNYIKSKSPDLFIEMCHIVGISPKMVEMNDENAGGAQWIIKNGDPEMWRKIETDSVALYKYMVETKDKYKPASDPYPVQAWTAEMWSMLWVPWWYGIKTQIKKELNFGWANHDIKSWEKNAIFHNAGQVKEDGVHMCKTTYQVSPFLVDIKVGENTASMEYVKLIRETEKMFPDLIWAGKQKVNPVVVNNVIDNAPVELMPSINPAKGIEVRKSNIPGAGRGIFTLNAIPKGKVIEECPVVEIPPEHYTLLKQSVLNSYYFKWNKNNCVLCLGFGSLYNHSMTPNIKYVKNKDNKLIIFYAARDISPGEELVHNYSEIHTD